MGTTQVAVRLDADLLERLDWLVGRGTYDNRAEVIRAAIEAMAHAEREREIDRQIVEAYTRQPQTDDEIASSGSRGFPGLPEEDWSDWL